MLERKLQLKVFPITFTSKFNNNSRFILTFEIHIQYKKTYIKIEPTLK